MTTAQLEHLRLIDAHLDRLLETASKRTPGEWTVDENLHDGGIRAPSDHVFLTREAYLDAPDAAFIASCAGNAEAGWKSTQRIIKEAIFLESDAPQEMSSILKILLEEWPIELITKHQ